MRVLMASCGLTVILCSCAVEPGRAQSFEIGQREVLQCTGSWESLLDEWQASGGGVHASLRETRDSVAADRKSRFARLVRSVWQAQRHETEVALKQPGALARIIEEQAEGYVRRGCEMPIYLENWWNRRLLSGRPSDMPDSVPEDLYPERNWLQTGIFTK